VERKEECGVDKTMGRFTKVRRSGQTRSSEKQGDNYEKPLLTDMK
jgi:hypothetical protein